MGSLLLIDHHDSFTYNLWQALQSLGCDVEVQGIDEVQLSLLDKSKYQALILSPGPGTPPLKTLKILQEQMGKRPILGVCLGHQAIGMAFGAYLKAAKQQLHGQVEPLFHEGQSLFLGLPSPLKVARYHSLVLDAAPIGFEVLAKDSHGDIMALACVEKRIWGLQFHPESFMCEGGERLLEAFVHEI